MAERETQADRLERQRNWLMLGYAVGWLGWQALQFNPVRETLGIGLAAAEIIAGIGLATWALTLALIVVWCVRVRRLKGTMGDELTASNSRRAMISGYWALTIGVAAATILIAAKAIEPITVMQMLCMLTFIPILRFVWLERAADV